MKILRIVVESIEVADDYVIQSPPIDSDTVTMETRGELFLAYQTEGDYSFLAIDAKMKNTSAIRRFLFWANIAWLDFYDDSKLPDKLKSWLIWFNAKQKEPSLWAQDLLKRRLVRRHEIRTRQVNYADFDPDLFDKKKVWFARN